MKSKVYRLLLSLNHDRQLRAFAFKLKHIHLVSWERCKKNNQWTEGFDQDIIQSDLL